MEFSPSSVQAKWILELVFSGEQPKKSTLSPRTQRDALQQAGFVLYDRRGRAEHVVLTDAAWAWAAGHLDADLGPRVRARLAEALLGSIRRYLVAGDVALADFVAPPDPRPALDDAERVHSAALAVAEGQLAHRVRLRDLRVRLTDLPPSRVDTALLALQSRGDIELFRFEDPTEKTAEDDAAAVRMAGIPHQMLYVRR